jgi:gliding motility-associated-like protein
MKRLQLILAFLCYISVVQAQNHVSNGSFEQYIKCPLQIDSFYKHFTDWYNYTYATPDYFHTCATQGLFGIPGTILGYQQAARGKAYAGIITYDPITPWREYIATAIQPLEIGKSYTVGVSVSLADKSVWASDGLGVYFRQGRDFVRTGDRLPYTPQLSFDGYGIISDSIGWTRLEGTFVADQPYDMMVLGSFKESPRNVYLRPGDQAYAYYFVDSVYVIPQGWRFPPEVNVSLSDTFFCMGDSLLLSYYLPNEDSFDAGNEFRLDILGADNKVVSRTSYKSYKPGIIRTVVSGQVPQGTYGLRFTTTHPPDTLHLDSIHIYSYPNINARIVNNNCHEDIGIRTDLPQGSTIYWAGPNNFSSREANPVIRQANEQHSGIYVAIAYNNGCNSIDSLEVKVDCSEIQVPTAFSPNGDGVNDLLYLYGTGNVKQLSFRIYNRWGQVIYESTDPGLAWDGSMEGSDIGIQTVAYVLQAVLKNGHTKHKTGNISVIR